MNKIIKRTLQTLTAVAIVSGTYFGRGHDDFPPLYSHKTGDSYGANVAIYTKIESGASINGLNLSIITNNYGQINGLNAGIRKNNFSEINGVSIQLANYSKDNSSVNGLEIGVVNAGNANIKNFNRLKECADLNGVAVGVINSHQSLDGLQIGIWNETRNNAGLIMNVDYQK
ncbi:MAG: hypothetical protein WC758_04245 [Candidatus Woesearchaeota archaeon]|jgi:hypothetical protein